MGALITVSEAEKLVLQAVKPAPAIRCPLNKSAGRILREDLVADRDLPPFDRVMMDGFAVRAADLPSPMFSITGKCMAGDPAGRLPEAAASAVEVMTGAPLPLGSDTIIPVEDVEVESNCFKVRGTVTSGQFVHRKGSDYAASSVLVKRGSVMRSVEAGIAASCGYAEVMVSQRPRITVFGTGDELIPIENRPEPHQIRQSNAIVIEQALASASYHVGKVGHLNDNEAVSGDALELAVNSSDLVVLSGAVSKGRRDWIPGFLDTLGTCLFHGVKQRPGRPMGLWVARNGCVVFALPGNPVSTIVMTHRYVIPFLQAEQGRTLEQPGEVELISEHIHQNATTVFIPARLVDQQGVELVPLNNSGDYARLSTTDGFVEFDDKRERWPAGSRIRYYQWK